MKEYMNDIEKLFACFDKSATLLSRELEITYLEALAEAGENVSLQDIVQDVNDEVKAELSRLLKDIGQSTFQREDVCKAFQLAILKGMREAAQPHHAPTPDAVGLFMSYLVQKLTKESKALTIVDPAIGSGNLVFAILNGLTDKKVRMYGFEVDETLLKLAYVSSNLQEQEIELFHEDSIRTPVIPEADLVITDLPIGYYPHDHIAENFQLKEEDGHSFSHYLMIERAMTACVPGGFVLLLIPNGLFEGEHAQKLNKYLKAEANIFCLLQLPQSMFKTELFGKSILLLQKKSADSIQPRQALFAQLPSFSKREQLTDMLKQIDRWFKEELQID